VDPQDLEEVLRNLDRRTARIEQILPPPSRDNSGEAAARPADEAVESLRGDIRRLAEVLDAIDKRDAAQHGGIKGELAHVVRRIARLESTPRTRQAR
jgi:hypothetical protein